MIHAVSKYDIDKEVNHHFDQLLKNQEVTGIYAPLDARFNQVHREFVGDFFYTAANKTFSFREVLINCNKVEPKRIREPINVMLIRARFEYLRPNNIMSRKLMTDSNDMAIENAPEDPVLEHRFRLCQDQVLGEGAFGMVIKGIDMQQNEEVAIKIFKASLLANDQKLRDRYRTENIKEASMLNELENGSNIIELISSGELNEYGVFLVFPLMQTDLDYVIAEEARMSKTRIKQITDMILTAARFMHSKGILHRDLKPGNILIDETGTVIVRDFGLSAKLAPNQQLELICGTRPYMSPEMMMVLGYNTAADIWV